MATNIDLNLDANGNGLLIGGSAQGGALPDFFRNDVYNFRLRILEENQDGERVDASLQSPSFKFGIGNLDEGPTIGSFQLTLAGPVTSLQIPYNASNLDVLNAISGIAGQVTVSSYGLEDQSWLITAATSNTALSFGGDSGTLFPTSSVLISTRRFPEADVKAQQVVKIRQSPSVYANNFTSAATAGIVSLVNTQEGSATANEVYRLSIGSDAIGGNYFIRYGPNSSTGIPIGITAASVQPILAAISGIGTGNIAVTDLDGQRGFSIAFTGSLAAQNITTALELDPTGIYFAKYYESLVTMGTAELDELFSSSEDLQINPVIEIEVSESSQAQTILQSSARIRKDLINAGAVIPATQESYYTKNEADSIFATIATINLNYYTKLEVDNLLDAITGAPVTGDYYTKAQSDNRYPTTAAISAAYYTKNDSDARYPTTAAISASYYTKTETNNLFVEDSPSNVNATSRWLVNSSTQTIVDWQGGLLGLAGAIQVPTAITASGVTISSVLNITTQTVVSGDLTVFGTISATGISFGDVYTRSEADTKFVINSSTGVHSSTRALFTSSGTQRLSWGGNSVVINGGLSVDNIATFSNINVSGAAVVDSLEVGGAFEASSISTSLLQTDSITVRATTASQEITLSPGNIICPSGNLTMNSVLCNFIECENNAEFLNAQFLGPINAVTITATTINADFIDVDKIQATTFNWSYTTISASSITVTTINVTCAFGMGGSASTARFQSVNAASINTSTSVTWRAFQVCSGGTAVTMWLFAGTSTAAAPSFIGYDEEARKITRQVLHILSENYFGFIKADSLTYP